MSRMVQPQAAGGSPSPAAPPLRTFFIATVFALACTLPVMLGLDPDLFPHLAHAGNWLWLSIFLLWMAGMGVCAVWEWHTPRQLRVHLLNIVSYPFGSIFFGVLCIGVLDPTLSNSYVMGLICVAFCCGSLALVACLWPLILVSPDPIRSLRTRHLRVRLDAPPAERTLAETPCRGMLLVAFTACPSAFALGGIVIALGLRTNPNYLQMALIFAGISFVAAIAEVIGVGIWRMHQTRSWLSRQHIEAAQPLSPVQRAAAATRRQPLADRSEQVSSVWRFQRWLRPRFGMALALATSAIVLMLLDEKTAQYATHTPINLLIIVAFHLGIALVCYVAPLYSAEVLHQSRLKWDLAVLAAFGLMLCWVGVVFDTHDARVLFFGTWLAPMLLSGIVGAGASLSLIWRAALEQQRQQALSESRAKSRWKTLPWSLSAFFVVLVPWLAVVHLMTYGVIPAPDSFVLYAFKRALPFSILMVFHELLRQVKRYAAV